MASSTTVYLVGGPDALVKNSYLMMTLDPKAAAEKLATIPGGQMKTVQVRDK